MSPEELDAELRSLVVSTRALIETSRAGVNGAAMAVIITAVIQLVKQGGGDKAQLLQIVSGCWGVDEATR